MFWDSPCAVTTRNVQTHQKTSYDSKTGWAPLRCVIWSSLTNMNVTEQSNEICDPAGLVQITKTPESRKYEKITKKNTKSPFPGWGPKRCKKNIEKIQKWRFLGQFCIFSVFCSSFRAPTREGGFCIFVFSGFRGFCNLYQARRVGRCLGVPGQMSSESVLHRCTPRVHRWLHTCKTHSEDICSGTPKYLLHPLVAQTLHQGCRATAVALHLCSIFGLVFFFGSQHPSPNVKTFCKFEPQIWLEIITSRDAKSACFKGSRTSCREIIFGIFWPNFGQKRSHHVMDASCRFLEGH